MERPIRLAQRRRLGLLQSRTSGLAVGLLATVALLPLTAALAQDSVRARGRAVFDQKGCVQCHSHVAKSLGPSVRDMTKRFKGDAAGAAGKIRSAPDHASELAALKREDIQALADWLADAGAATSSARAAVEPAPRTADAAATKSDAAPAQTAEAKAQARREAREKAKQEAEAKAQAKRDAAAQAKRDAEAKAQAKRDAAAQAQKEAEARAQAKRDAVAAAQREKDEHARREAEARAKKDTEALAALKREADERARREAEAGAREKREAEERARREAEAQAQAKREAEAQAQARREAEAKAKKEAEAQAQAKRDAEAKAKKEADAPAKGDAEQVAKAAPRDRGAKREYKDGSDLPPCPPPSGAPIGAVDEERAKAIIERVGCPQCHAYVQKKTGPPFKKVFEKYKGDPDCVLSRLKKNKEHNEEGVTDDLKGPEFKIIADYVATRAK